MALPVGAVPNAAGGAVVVVAGDHEHGQGHGADRFEHLQGGADRHGGGIEQIACHHHRAGPLGTGGRPDAAEAAQPFLLQTETFLGIAHNLVGLADLPVGAVQDPHPAWGRPAWAGGLGAGPFGAGAISHGLGQPRAGRGAGH